MNAGDVRFTFTRMMLKASGSTCYNARGITFPRMVAINFEEELRVAGGIDIRWMPYDPPMLVPDVITWVQGAVSTCEWRYPRLGNGRQLMWSEAVTPSCFVYKREWYDFGLLEMPARVGMWGSSISPNDYPASYWENLLAFIRECGAYDLMRV